MPDLDKAIGQLEADIKHADRIGALFVYIGRKQAKDVLDLLKEQEAKLVLNIADSIAGMEIGNCPGCGRYLVNKISDPSKFCKYCGQAVKWE